MIEQIIELVSHTSLPQTLTALVLVIFFLGTIIRFGGNSINAVSCGIYNMMVIAAVFVLSMKFSDARISGPWVRMLASSMISRVFTPLLDLFGAYNNYGWDISDFLYVGGRLLILAIVIEILERIINKFAWRKNFMIWIFTEYLLVILSCVCYFTIWNEIEASVSYENLHLIVICGFLLVIFVVSLVIGGFFTVFGSWAAKLNQMLYEYFMTVMVTVIFTILLTKLIRELSLMPRIYGVINSLSFSFSIESLVSTICFMLLSSLVWYSMFRLIRVH
ncbi:MAG: hypothetical protein IKE58_08085 [Blautia sp.]|nr:hypothetical protein [Blautia sp.]